VVWVGATRTGITFPLQLVKLLLQLAEDLVEPRIMWSLLDMRQLGKNISFSQNPLMRNSLWEGDASPKMSLGKALRAEDPPRAA
jgi:hypothetical protein